MQVPIACTLSAREAGERVGEWRRFLSASIDAAEVTGTNSLRLRLKPGPAVLCEAADLARREVTCCAFFEFSITVNSAACFLVVGVPPEAAEILSEFAGMIPSEISGGT